MLIILVLENGAGYGMEYNEVHGTIEIILFHLPNLSTPVKHIELEASTIEKSRVCLYAFETFGCNLYTHSTCPRMLFKLLIHKLGLSNCDNYSTTEGQHLC